MLSVVVWGFRFVMQAVYLENDDDAKAMMQLLLDEGADAALIDKDVSRTLKQETIF